MLKIARISARKRTVTTSLFLETTRAHYGQTKKRGRAEIKEHCYELTCTQEFTYLSR